ncbi:MAG TPA: GntR family transcriptional regulator [Hyphomicrobiaceae bacterium]|nr:GntR family transcriptional regulator [Hyphomicrobiaceae bacterium]
MQLTSVQAAPQLIDQVYDRLLSAIVDGTLAPGERLTQESVAALLGVSRQPVSHALQVLRRRGLVVETGKRGLSVAPIDGARIRDLYQVREALDAIAARLAAERVVTGALSTEERREAEDCLACGARLADGCPTAELIAADVAFHSTLYRLSGNGAIAETVAEQWPHFMRSMGAVLGEGGAVVRVWAEHAGILEAVLAGIPHLAAERARAHSARAGEATGRRLEALSQSADAAVVRRSIPA